MNIEQVRDFTLSLHGVTEDQPFGDDNITFRVEGKIFLCLWLGDGRCVFHDIRHHISRKISTLATMITKQPIILLNFTGVYDYEAFASSPYITHVDCRDISGVDCYCDEEARAELRRRLAPYPAKALHFIDSGDFHYLTEYWVSRLREPFSLIVFDHHPDMQQPQWEGVVSCGGWVADVLRNNPFVRNIIVVGASDELIAQIPDALREKVVFYSQAEIDHHRAWPSKAGCLIHEPVYISIDKDVLRKQDAVTDWSNGDMTLLQLQAVLRIIYAHERVVGVDITGECSASLDYLSELKSAAVDNRANEELMQMICQHDCG